MSTNVQPIVIKGKTPKGAYDCFLSNVFYSFEDRVFSVNECISLLQSECEISLNNDLLVQMLFSYRKFDQTQHSRELPFTFAGPFQMKSVLDTQFPFNLRYQDVIIKCALEKQAASCHQNKTAEEKRSLHWNILQMISVVLRTCFLSTEPLYLDLTNAELDHVVSKCLAFFGIKSTKKDLIDIGNKSNAMARSVQNHILSAKQLSLKQILAFSIHSGVVWWAHDEILSKFEANSTEIVLELRNHLENLVEENGLIIDDFALFHSEVIDTKESKQLLYFFDDNGELVWDLLFIKCLLESNPKLTIIGVVSETPITNNASIRTLSHYIKQHDNFLGLRKNKKLLMFGEPNELSAIDPRFISEKLKKQMMAADVILVKGASFFEKLQYLPAPTYYMFTVYSKTSQILTGLKCNNALFARIGAHLCGFDNIREKPEGVTTKMTLHEIHNSLQTYTYREFVRCFGNEEETNLFLRSKALEKGLTLSALIDQLTTF